MKKHQKKQQKATKKQAWISYIVVGAVAVLGVTGLILPMRILHVTEKIVRSTPMPQNTAAPVFAQPEPIMSETEKVVAQVPQIEMEKKEETTKEVMSHRPPFEIEMPCEGEVLVGFSKDKLVLSKTLGDWRAHNGIDVAADLGNEVKAAADGIVEKAYLDPLMGHTIIVRHDEEHQTIYQNLASTEMVKEGQAVAKGQCLGAVGDSAPAEMLERAHLHFAVMEKETFVNPIDFVKH